MGSLIAGEFEIPPSAMAPVRLVEEGSFTSPETEPETVVG